MTLRSQPLQVKNVDADRKEKEKFSGPGVQSPLVNVTQYVEIVLRHFAT